MSILNEEELDKQMGRYVLDVLPKENEFEKSFEDSIVPPILIDAQLEASMSEIAQKLGAGYFDLAAADSYEALAGELPYHPDGIIFDNVDAIPESEDKEWIEQLVRFALKQEDDVNLTPRASINFSAIKVGARCRQYPEFLESIYTAIFKIWI